MTPPIIKKPPVSMLSPGATQTPTYPPNPAQNRGVDYATPSIYQSNDPYVNKRIPNPGPPMHTMDQPSPQVSSFASATPPAPTQPIISNPTGQFGVTAGSNPFNAAQPNAQTPTTTGTAAKPPPAPKPKPKPKPKHHKPSAIDKYLGKDADYQNTIRDLNRALADFKARQGVEKTRAGTENSYAQRTMGLQSQQDLSDIQNDAAARGIVTSGVYGQRVGDYNTTYNEQIAELGRQYKSQLDDFSSALADFNRQQSLQKESARTAAIRRRSAKLGKVG